MGVHEVVAPRPRHGEGSEGGQRAPWRRAVLCWLAAVLTATCLAYGRGWGGAGRQDGRDVLLLGGVGGGEGVAPDGTGAVHVRAQAGPAAPDKGSNTEAVSGAGALSKAAERVGSARSTALTFGHGCKGKTLYKYGDTYACGGPLHEDSGMMAHENHCMLVADHGWDFVGAQGLPGVLRDPGSNYCLAALRSPWSSMVGLEVCNGTDKSMLWEETTHVNGVFGYMREGNHHVKEYENMMNGMLLNRGCGGKCYNAQICIPTAEYRRRVWDSDFLPKNRTSIMKYIVDDPIAPIRR